MSNKESITVTVYGLSSTEDGKIRYVGQTTTPLNKRLIHHHYDAKKLDRIHKSNWIRSVIERGFQVQIFSIEENAVLHEAEIKWIAWHRAQGADLVNTTVGGEGVFGYQRTPEQNQAHAEKMRGRTSPRKGVKLSPETRAKISAVQIGRIPWNKGKVGSMTGIRKSAQGRANIAAAQAKKKKPPLTPEEIAARKAQRSANCSAWQKGRVLPESQKAKIAEGLTRSYANGRRGAQSKLSDDEVREVRFILAAGIPQNAIADAYGISPGALSEIKNGKSYRHVSNIAITD